MTDWRGRLKAVVTLGLPPEPKDGEVQCINPTCRNTKLNRKDMTCWRCGGDRFAPASDEMRHALRFNYVPPPRRVEKPKEPPQPQQTYTATLFGLPFPFPPTATQPPSPSIAASPTPGGASKAWEKFFQEQAAFDALYGMQPGVRSIPQTNAPTQQSKPKPEDFSTYEEYARAVALGAGAIKITMTPAYEALARDRAARGLLTPPESREEPQALGIARTLRKWFRR